LQNTNFLNEIYQSVQLSIEEIENVLYCIKNQKIFKEIKKQKEEYEKVLIICQKKFKEELKEVSFIFKIGSNIVSQIKLMKNSSDKEILKNFLETVLDEEITEIEVTNQFSIDKIRYEDKVGVLDVKAKVNQKEIVDIEMQRNKQNYYIQRILLYTGKMEATQLSVSERYNKLKQVISINILDFIMFPGIENMHTVWNLCEKNNKEYILPGIEYHFLELPKFRKSNPDLELKINQWLALIDTENKEWVEVAMKNNDSVKKAINKVDEFVADDETRILIELREKWQRDYYNSMEDAKEEGLQAQTLQKHIDRLK